MIDHGFLEIKRIKNIYFNNIFFIAIVEPPFIVKCERLAGGVKAMNVSWTPPENPQFDIDHYIVRSYRDGQIYTATTRDESLLVEISGETYADVRSVSTCGTISSAQRCPETVSALQNSEVKVPAAGLSNS